MKAMIFDADGTLLDSMGLWEQIDRDFLKNHHYPYSKKISDLVKTMSLMQSSRYFYDLLSAQENITVEEIAGEIDGMCTQAYACHIQAKPFVQEFLRAAKREGFHMCVATASKKDQIIGALKRLGLLEYFQFVLGADEMKNGKSDPEIFLECARRMGTKPKETWVFEDAPHAAQTAQSAGFPVVGLFDEWARDMGSDMEKFCVRYVKTFGELLMGKNVLI